MESLEHFFYVLTCADGSLYGGYTNNLERRVKLHNQGKGAKYTRGRGPVTLTLAKSFHTKREAMQAEYQFKQLTRKQKLDYIKKETGDAHVAAKEFRQ
ncbi:GIY-YIG nuclease family protein [Bacillus rubiinfantis]|uniref:GIY-YIG nuclease family protein n=1 Tax=Bacillus rubiinfantis TaxID=1499680 RepID=UPI0005A68B0B|nr:GIY-YIG nuclease family protein [Bacillus rubiinfantis]